MATNIQQQLAQIQDILDTLEEATDHFSELIKRKELHQGTFMFSTIVEGYEAVKGSLNTSDKNLIQVMAKLEQYMLMIAQQLEQRRLVKISEIVQFSFKPQLKKFKQSFADIYGASI